MKRPRSALPFLAPLVLPWLSFIACGGSAPPPHKGTDGTAHGSTSVADTRQRPESVPPQQTSDDRGGAGATPADGPNEAACLELVDHILALGLDEQRRTKAPELVPTEAQVATIREGLAKEMMPGCQLLPPDEFACLLRAPSQDEMIRCQLAADPGPQR